MILDSLANASLYGFISARLDAGFHFLRSNNLASLPLGRTDIAPSLFALVQDYIPKPLDQGFWESHRRHIDIQCLVTGSERIGHAPISTLQVTDPFNEEKDLIKYSGTGDFLTLRASDFAVFFPHDGHMPGIQLPTPSPNLVRKIVIKVAV
ncbi:MAG TPA: YhcH/YjgK/YiaL family protein [Tepidisphaeraceae bacterium]|jgi:YhcH/YjgK/YiaL family protein|nr:YhcH/YjgK/YiaL family protein [Tepidisphaeraceae bacterium]